MSLFTWSAKHKIQIRGRTNYWHKRWCQNIISYHGLVWKESREFWLVISTCVWKLSDVKFRVLQKGFAHVFERYRRNACCFHQHSSRVFVAVFELYHNVIFLVLSLKKAYLVISIEIKVYPVKWTKELYCLCKTGLGMNGRKPVRTRVRTLPECSISFLYSNQCCAVIIRLSYCDLMLIIVTWYCSVITIPIVSWTRETMALISQ